MIRTPRATSAFSCTRPSHPKARELAESFPEAAEGSVGNPREDLVVYMFSRVTDLENFWKVLDTVGEDRELPVVQRLGWLNVLNPQFADRCRSLRHTPPGFLKHETAEGTRGRRIMLGIFWQGKAFEVLIRLHQIGIVE